MHWMTAWIALALVSPLAAQPGAQPHAAKVNVYIYHDAGYFSAGYLDPPKGADAVEYHRLMANALGQELARHGVSSAIIDAEGWAEVCGQGRRCIVVDIAQSVPSTVYSGQDDGSPLKRWLQAGGLLCYSGDWFAHWYASPGGGHEGSSACQSGDDDIFGADLVRDGFVGIACEPTEAAQAVLPGFKGWRTSRPFDADAVVAACPWHEFYGLGRRPAAGGILRAADPLAFRVPGGRGYFFGCRFGRSTHTDSAQMVCDFILNRGLSLLKDGDPQ